MSINVVGRGLEFVNTCARAIERTNVHTHAVHHEDEVEVANTRTMQSGTSAWRGLNETHFHRRIVGTDSLTRRDIRRREQRPTRQKPLVGVLIFFLRSTTELVYRRYTANYAAVKIRPVRVLFLRTRFDRKTRRFQRVSRKSDFRVTPIIC